MYDFCVPNATPGTCEKCLGSGQYRWGAIINGVASKSGQCHSCLGTGQQTQKDIHRNTAYNRHKLASISL